MKKHILVISQYFYPENFRINDICKEWVKRGYEVTVVTGIPNYPQGKFFDGYGLFKKRKEEYKGIRIIRLPIVSRGKGSIRLALNYFSYVFSGFFWKMFTRIKADKVFVFEVSPMTQALIGVWYTKKHKVPNYLYVQDLWPENVEIVTGITSPVVIKPISSMVNYIYKNCTDIFATSPSFVKEIQKRVKDKEKVHYLPQYAEDFYIPVKKQAVPEIPQNDKFKVIFTGNIGQAQGLDILPKTAQLLKDENIEFLIVGDGRYREEFEKEILQCGVSDMFVLIERQPAEYIPQLLAACDAAFISFQNAELWRMTIPAKLQSYMACGMPIIASAFGETQRIIEEAECGLCAPIGDEKALAQHILKLKKEDLSAMAEKSRSYYKKHFDKQSVMDGLNEYFEK